MPNFLSRIEGTLDSENSVKCFRKIFLDDLAIAPLFASRCRMHPFSKDSGVILSTESVSMAD